MHWFPVQRHLTRFLLVWLSLLPFALWPLVSLPCISVRSLRIFWLHLLIVAEAACADGMGNTSSRGDRGLPPYWHREYRCVLCLARKRKLPAVRCSGHFALGQQKIVISQRSFMNLNHGAAIQVEQPFEVLALDTYCRGCEASVVEIMETYQGQPRVCGAGGIDRRADKASSWLLLLSSKKFCIQVQ